MNVIYGQLIYYKKLICTFTISRDQPIMFILLLRYSVVLKHLICYAHYISLYWCKMALNRILQQLQNIFSVKSVKSSSWNSKCLWVGVTDLRSVLQNCNETLQCFFPFVGFCWIVSFWHRAEGLCESDEIEVTYILHHDTYYCLNVSNNYLYCVHILNY